MLLRNYQKKAIEVSKKDEQEIILELTMGSGKSLVLSEIAKFNQQCKIVVVLTNISILIDQLDKHLKISNIDTTIIKANQHRIGSSNVYLIMEQSFHISKRNEYKHLKGCILLRDEIHVGYNGKRYKEIIDFLEPTKIIGVSGTPYNEDGTFLGNNIPYTILSSPEAIKQGYLTPIRWFIPRIIKDIDLSEAKMSGNDYSTNSLAEIYSTSQFDNAFLDFFKQIEPSERHILIFCSNIDHAEHIGSLLKDYNAIVVHSKQNDEYNEKTIKQFKDGDINIIVSVSKLSIGFDAPIADTLINLRPTKIMRLWQQIAFRVCRLYPNKKYADIFDLGRCIEEFGLIDTYHYVPQETKEEAKQIIKEYQINEFDNIIELKEEEPIIEFSNDKIKIYIEEIKKKKQEALKSRSLPELIKAFNLSNDFRGLLQLGSLIYDEIYGTNTKQSTLDWIFNKWIDILNMLPQKEIYFKKVFKTRFKNIIKQHKKIASLYYFADFIAEQLKINEPWLFENHIDIYEDDEIQF